MSVIEERLTPLDSTFLELEQADEGAMMHIGGALIFDPLATGGPPSLEQLRALLDERLGTLPRFRCRLSEPRVHGLRRPAWVEDPTFDLRAQVRHATLPAPGGDSEVHEWLADFWSHRLDRARPLWEMTLVDGLEDGGWMLATKTHHAMVDGVGSVDIGHILLDAELNPGPRTPAEPSQASEGDKTAPHLPGWLPPVIAARIARAAIDTALHPGRLIHAGEAAVAMSEVLWQDEIMAARDSTLNVPISTTRRFVSVAFELAEVKEVKHTLGGTVNDVVLAVATGALRRLLAYRGEALDRPLRAMVPVNLRGDDHESPGNQVTSLFVELPIAATDTRRRYDQTRAAATKLKSGTAALGGSTIVLVAGAAPPLLHESIARTLFAPRLFNLTITNVPGPQFRLYALGARMRRILPLVPLFADHALGMAIVSYDGELVFGINADYAATPDLDVLQTAMRDEFAALLSLARS
jgi:diacylglycerol O-acyltransferase / wax synthase